MRESSWPQLIFTAVLVLFVARMYVARRGGTPLALNKADDVPIIASGQLLGGTDLMSVHQDITSGFKYNFLISNGGKQVMFNVQLGHDTYMHVIGYGAKSRLEPQIAGSINSKWLQRVNLEGDFAKVFTLYCTPGRQVELLEVFTPDVMAQFADFCQAYDLEIFRETLYISQPAGAFDKDDRTALITDLENFLAANGRILNRL